MKNHEWVGDEEFSFTSDGLQDRVFKFHFHDKIFMTDIMKRVSAKNSEMKLRMRGKIL